ncbi:serine/threonine-protein kinase PLK1-like [Oscarella lobularis]|uniref:serine/threonine-protein kinase PLK1-like n=1 Tax=Oscarella lobularis TaxID=121494 RepID=UPI0033131CA3
MSTKDRIRTAASDSDADTYIVDPKTRKTYLKGQFLGKGGFARCYELKDMTTNEVFAGKIVSKSLLTKQHQKEKMSMEIAVHRSLNHENIVGFDGYFEDSENVYVLLEICRRRSLMELRKRRRVLTEAEVRYYMKQILLGCQYLHGVKVIHRDLKLGNIFLDDGLILKIGDFGLAAKIDYEGERKRTLCGTPNYIAPEILNKKGHSYEVDLWSIGCIMYTLLVGKPPFETKSLEETYSRIKRNDYFIPHKVSPAAQSLIVRLLRSDPSERPATQTVLNDPFFSAGFAPTRLRLSCLTMAPRFYEKKTATSTSGLPRKPLSLVNKDGCGAAAGHLKGALSSATTTTAVSVEPSSASPLPPTPTEFSPCTEPSDYFLSDLLCQLSDCLKKEPEKKSSKQWDEAEDPASQPIYWISKWVDYSDKYGLGYQLSDNSVGVLFNDNTHILLAADGENLHYIDRDGHEEFHMRSQRPEHLKRKVTLLNYYSDYMSDHLLKTGAAMGPKEGDEIARLPHLRSWFCTQDAIVLHLNLGILQINFFRDHTKIIFCPRMGAVSYIDEKGRFRTYRLSDVGQYGCSKELASRLDYGRVMVERLMGNAAAVKGPGKMVMEPEELIQ